MRFSPKRAMTIARREYLTTVKRRAFLFTVIFMPVYFAGITTLTGSFASNEVRRNIRETSAVGVVDSSGAFTNAPDSIKTEMADGNRDSNVRVIGGQRRQQAQAIERITTYSAVVRRYASQDEGQQALRRCEEALAAYAHDGADVGFSLFSALSRTGLADVAEALHGWRAGMPARDGA